MAEQMVDKGRNRPDQGRLTALALALLAVLFVAANIVIAFAMPAQRVDLTEDRLYTLSDGTRTILSGIEEPITLRFYFSSRLGTALPAYGVYAERVLDLLREYEDLADGMIELEIFDPEPFSTVEDRAVAFGLQSVPLEGVDGNVFFGVVGTNLTDDVEAIPFLQPDRESLLEFDLSQMIYALSNPASRTIGLMSTLTVDTEVRMGQSGRPENTPPKVAIQSLRDQFEVIEVPVDAHKIPDEVDLLMLVHPRRMSPRTLFAIDQFILGGGKAVVFVDPAAEMQPGIAGESTLDPMFAAWGLEMPTDKVVGDRFAARRIGSQSGRGFTTYVPWLLLRGPNLNKESPLTAQLGSLALATAGHLKLADDASVTLDPLVTSSPGSMLIDRQKVIGGRPNPEALLAEYQPGPERYTLAGIVRGAVPSAFPDGQPPLEEGEDPQEDAVFDSPLAQSARPIEVVVVADTDILDDRFWVQVQNFFGRRVTTPSAGNGDFVVNAADALTGSSELLELRGRGSAYRPFEVIERLKREADRKFQSKEQELSRTLAETERKLAELRERQGPPDATGPVALTSEERAQVSQYQRQILRLRTELREVQRSLREDVERLETRVLIANIAGMPVLIALLAIGLAVWRSVRRRRRAAAMAES